MGSINKIMNVLILTPDRVGSTLLQRLLTIYMLRRGFELPVINLHELSNGLEKYFNDTLGQECLRKPQGQAWGYYQTLPEIQTLLSSVNHYKTSRLAHYHLLNRKDSISDQLAFYRYLNENFYIISCRRENLFEHALSWVIYSHSKNLNVYTADEKIRVFESIYQTGITATEIGIHNYLDRYRAYTDWVRDYFDVQSYFDYDRDMADLEKYILNLDFMRGSESNTWRDMFGQDFRTWNACHRMIPNLLLNNHSSDATMKITVNTQPITQSNWDQVRGPDWPLKIEHLGQTALPQIIDQEIKQRFNLQTVAVTPQQHQFLTDNLGIYNRTAGVLEQLRDRGLLVTGVPIKLQSLQEKKDIIRNFDQCVTWYNQWCEKTQFAQPYSEPELDQRAQAEEMSWSQQLEQTVYQALSGN